MVDIQSPTAEIRRGKKLEDKNHREKYNGLPYSTGHSLQRILVVIKQLEVVINYSHNCITKNTAGKILFKTKMTLESLRVSAVTGRGMCDHDKLIS